MLGADPFCGTVYVFQAKRTDLAKLLWWDGRRVEDTERSPFEPLGEQADAGATEGG